MAQSGSKLVKGHVSQVVATAQAQSPGTPSGANVVDTQKMSQVQTFKNIHVLELSQS